MRTLLTKIVPVFAVILGLALAGCSGGLRAYTSLIGLSRMKIEEKLGIDEGGLSFSKSGMRIWFDDNSQADDVFTTSKDTDFGGARIGGTPADFEKAFGVPVKADVGYAIFPYENVFLEINYNPKTGIVVAVHIIKEVW